MNLNSAAYLHPGFWHSNILSCRLWQLHHSGVCHFPSSQKRKHMSSLLSLKWNYFATDHFKNKKYDFAYLWISFWCFLFVWEDFFLSKDVGSNYGRLSHIFYFPFSYISGQLKSTHPHYFHNGLYWLQESLSTDAPCEIEKKDVCS